MGSHVSFQNTQVSLQSCLCLGGVETPVFQLLESVWVTTECLGSALTLCHHIRLCSKGPEIFTLTNCTV